jgi:hypothetical protein
MHIPEYWHYLDRPETFVRYVAVPLDLATGLTFHSIGRSDDDVGRMLEVLRFWFTKDLVWLPPASSNRHPDPTRNMLKANHASLTIPLLASSSG